MNIQTSKNFKTFNSLCISDKGNKMECIVYIELFMLHAFAAVNDWTTDGNGDIISEAIHIVSTKESPTRDNLATNLRTNLTLYDLHNPTCKSVCPHYHI